METRGYLELWTSQGTKILMMTPTLFCKVLPEMISMAAVVKVIQPIMAESVDQVT